MKGLRLLQQFIPHQPKPETMQVSMSRRTDSNEKEQTTDGYGNLDGSQKHYSKIRKPDTEEYTLQYSVYVKFKNSPNWSTEQKSQWFVLSGASETGEELT